MTAGLSRTAIKQLKAMKAALKKYGWIRGTMGDESCGFCLHGAAQHVGAGDVALQALCAVATRRGCADFSGDYVTWNDTKAKNRAHVLGFIDAAIKQVPRLKVA